MDMTPVSRRLVLRYDPGQFSFRHFDQTANDTQLFNLAQALNAFQEDALDSVVRVVVTSF
jgi:hypothetical protein